MRARGAIAHRDERGVALVLSLFLMLAMSVVGASLMFLSQTETYSSMNYRQMSQARYGAESGIQKTANYLLYSYAAPATGSGDPMTNYNTTGSPVTYNGSPVILSADSAVASNYPIAEVQAAFAAAAQGSLVIGSTVNYLASAKLIAMEEVPASQSATGVAFTTQTWEITSNGTITTGTRTAQVQVSATLEQSKLPGNHSSYLFAAFATADTCGALKFSGTGGTDSYHMDGGTPVIDTTNIQGNVGTNGNLTESGNATINGTLSSPRVGVGACSEGNVDAQTSSGNATVTGGIVHLPQPITVPTPAAPDPLPGTTNLTINSSASCADFGLAPPATCAGAAGMFTITPNGSTISLPNLNLSGGAVVTLVGGTYNVNSVSLAGNSQLIIDSGPVIMNVAGKNADGSWMTTPIDFSGGTTSNPTYDSADFQIQYAGTGAILLTGGSSTSEVIYAPNAAVTISGNADIYGEIIGKTIVNGGNGTIHYDTNLANSGLFEITTFGKGNQMLGSFTWKKY